MKTLYRIGYVVIFIGIGVGTVLSFPVIAAWAFIKTAWEDSEKSAKRVFRGR